MSARIVEEGVVGDGQIAELDFDLISMGHMDEGQELDNGWGKRILMDQRDVYENYDTRAENLDQTE